jgi:REP element-mobilizing transposase RayT
VSQGRWGFALLHKNIGEIKLTRRASGQNTVVVKSREKLQQALFKQRGGKRRGAGRKPKGRRSSAPHKKRPVLKGRFPVHVTLRVVDELGSLRRRRIYAAFRRATITVALHEWSYAEDGAFRIVHVSIQRDHAHLLVEAANAAALSRGMQSFQISAAKHINREASVGQCRRRKGKVFADRYHQEIITTPRQARHALAYVLNNWRKHREDRRRSTCSWNVDPFSTGLVFHGWKAREDAVNMWRRRETYEPLAVYVPRTWLLQQGWRKGGPPLAFREVPGPRFRAGAG